MQAQAASTIYQTIQRKLAAVSDANIPEIQYPSVTLDAIHSCSKIAEKV